MLTEAQKFLMPSGALSVLRPPRGGLLPGCTLSHSLASPWSWPSNAMTDLSWGQCHAVQAQPTLMVLLGLGNLRLSSKKWDPFRDVSTDTFLTSKLGRVPSLRVHSLKRSPCPAIVGFFWMVYFNISLLLAVYHSYHKLAKLYHS